MDVRYKVYEYWFSFLLEPKYDLNTQSQCSLIRTQRDSVLTPEPGCVLTWPRFRSLISAEEEPALRLACCGGGLLLTSRAPHAGGCVAERKRPARPEKKLFFSDQRRPALGEAQLWEFRVRHCGRSGLGELFQEGTKRLKLLTSCKNYSVYC